MIRTDKDAFVQRFSETFARAADGDLVQLRRDLNALFQVQNLKIIAKVEANDEA